MATKEKLHPGDICLKKWQIKVKLYVPDCVDFDVQD